MRIIDSGLPGVVLLEPAVHGDARGYFMEAWHAGRYGEAGLPRQFVQCNVSRSEPGVIRGLHYQHPQPQGKLVSVLQGRVFDVAVDVRAGSPTFGQWAGAELSAENHRQLYIPEGFAHGFCVLGEPALLVYLCTAEYRSEYDAALAWDDPDIGVQWPVATGSLSTRDASAPRLADMPAEQLPRFDPPGAKNSGTT